MGLLRRLQNEVWNVSRMHILRDQATAGARITFDACPEWSSRAYGLWKIRPFRPGDAIVPIEEERGPGDAHLFFLRTKPNR